MKETYEFDESLDGHYKSYKLNDVNLLQSLMLWTNKECYVNCVFCQTIFV